MPYESENARHVPALYFVLKDFLDGTLDENWFPFLGSKPTNDDSGNIKAPAAGWSRKKPNWATRRERQDSSPQESTPTRPRVVVFIIGGMSMNEICTVQKLQDEYGVEVVIGSTMILTPDSFIEALKMVGNRGDDSYYGYKRPPKPRRPIADGRERPARSSSKPETQDEKNFFQKGFFRRASNDKGASSERVSETSSRARSGSRELNTRDRTSSRENNSRPEQSRPERIRREATPIAKEKKGWFGFKKE